MDHVVQLNEAARSLDERWCPCTRYEDVKEERGAEELRAQNRELREKLSKLPPDPVHDISTLALNELEAKLRVWQQAKPDIVVPNEETAMAAICQHKLKEDMDGLCKAMFNLRTQFRTFECRLKREREVLRMCEALHTAMADKLQRLTAGDTAVQRALREAEVECGRLQATLERFTAKKQLEEKEEDGLGKRKSEGSTEPLLDKDVVDFIQVLVGRYGDNEEGGDSYLSADAMSAEQLKMLRRTSVLQSHPDHPHLLRVAPHK